MHSVLRTSNTPVLGTKISVANFLNLSWNTVKELQKRYLHQHFAYPDIRNVRNIGIDEFAAKKGHVYKTIVVDLDTGHIIYVGNGKSANSLRKFWKKVKKYLKGADRECCH